MCVYHAFYEWLSRFPVVQLRLRTVVMASFTLCLVLLWLVQPRHSCASFQFSWLGLMPMQVLPLPCPALPCPALPCPALPCPALLIQFLCSLGIL